MGGAVPRALAVLGAVALGPAPGGAATFEDPLDVPAPASAVAARAPLVAVAARDGHLVAVGPRGHAVWSRDGGASWRQGAVPVATDLTAVHLVSATRGWAVGHDGVVLATVDGGRTWTRQLDRRRTPAADGVLLGVWFADERTGFAVGAFGLALATEDGGATWTSWAERTENPRGLHLSAVGRAAGRVWMVGEAGLVLRLDERARRFRRIPVPAAASLLGVTGDAQRVLVHGARGTVLRSGDGGETWERVGGCGDDAVTAAALLPGGRAVLAAGAARFAIDGPGRPCRLVAGSAPPPRVGWGVAPAGEGRLVVTGPGGAFGEAGP